MSSSTRFLSDDCLLRHYTHEMEHIFKTKYRECLQQFKRVQQDPSIEPHEKINHFHLVSWKAFHLRFMIHIYILVLHGNRRFLSSCYIHHNVFGLDKFLTPDRREKHADQLLRHEQTMERLLRLIWEKIYYSLHINTVYL